MNSALAAMASPSAQPARQTVDTDSAHLRLAEMAMAIWPARAIYAAAHLAIPDHLAAEALPLDDIARLTGTHVPSLRRLLRALASCGIVTEISPGALGLPHSETHYGLMCRARQELSS